MTIRGTARTFYIEDELWMQVERLVEAGYAKNLSHFVKEAVKILSKTV